VIVANERRLQMTEERHQEEEIPDLDVPVEQSEDVKGGGKPQKADGSLDAGIHFKYDIKSQKEG
jgi:hypothetical protein